jgi:hypothetical protein
LVFDSASPTPSNFLGLACGLDIIFKTVSTRSRLGGSVPVFWRHLDP